MCLEISSASLFQLYLTGVRVKSFSRFDDEMSICSFSMYSISFNVVMFFLSVISEEQTRDAFNGSTSQYPAELVKRATLPVILEPPTYSTFPVPIVVVLLPLPVVLEPMTISLKPPLNKALVPYQHKQNY